MKSVQKCAGPLKFKYRYSEQYFSAGTVSAMLCKVVQTSEPVDQQEIFKC